MDTETKQHIDEVIQYTEHLSGQMGKVVAYTEYLAEHIDTLIQFVDSNPDIRTSYNQFKTERSIHIEKFNPNSFDPQNRLRF
jgi:hypothetical protein